MCPACIENAAVMAAGVGSAGGILAVCLSKIRKVFRADGLGLFSETLFHKIFISENQEK